MSKKLIIKYIREEFEKEGYKLLTEIYKNARQKLDYICPKGHENNIRWFDWKFGCRCSYCAGNKKLTIDFIKTEFEKEGYELLSDKYINAHQKLKYICSKGHKHGISWDRWQRGQRCPGCINRVSKGEIEVKNFIESLGVTIVPNDKSQIFNPITERGLELDIFIPTLSKAVEYNGEYWHRDKRNRVNNDLLKQRLCESKGIDLLTIWDEKWKTKNKACRNKIKKFIFAISDERRIGS